ncbi:MULTISPECIES: NAD(P)/FAD-dependent oxidoreductase [unclassified Novosphingobium]|uniref:NAD(P)/FAD-dependent oxidoreductase n=1 Tax=unclassified Novosphingobium TaxID=2644732 RepID=UPI00135A4CCA|nr:MULTISPECIES: FAD-dependent monooxygenase [unclassified Novosphingobium]
MTDALVIGAGLAGSAAACLLARGGMSVRLLERESAAHHKVCGEFLSVEAVAHLRQLGVDPKALGAMPITRIRLLCGTIKAEAPLPFGALGLSRHALDEVLLGRAEAAGVQVERGVRVLELGDRSVRTSHGDRTGRHLLLATGKLSVRKPDGALPRRAAESFVGFKMHYRLAPGAVCDLAGTIVLALLEDGYAGLQMIEGGRANLCLVLRRNRLALIGGDWNGVRSWLGESPGLRGLLADAEPLFERPVTIANLTYGLPSLVDEGHVLRLGDQWAMTASLTGDGMAIALRSAFLAAQCVMAGDARSYPAQIAAEARGQVGRAMLLQNALHHPRMRWAGVRLARLYPPLLTHAARATRLPEWEPRGNLI